MQIERQTRQVEIQIKISRAYNNMLLAPGAYIKYTCSLSCLYQLLFSHFWEILKEKKIAVKNEETTVNVTWRTLISTGTGT
jgi:hypothetical protein